MLSLAWKKSSGLLAAKLRRSAACWRSVVVLRLSIALAGSGVTLLDGPSTGLGLFDMVSTVGAQGVYANGGRTSAEAAVVSPQLAVELLFVGVAARADEGTRGQGTLPLQLPYS